MDEGLAAADVARFDLDGFLHLPGRVAPDLLGCLRVAAGALCRNVERRWREAGAATNASCLETDDGPATYRINMVMGRDDLADPLPFWAVLGCPGVLAVARALCGPDALPTQADLVVKRASHRQPIGWHQDSYHPAAARYLAMGLYLDDSRPGDGGLSVVPGSHRAIQDVCGLEAAHGWDMPGAVEVPAAAGDMVLHHVMALHASAALRQGAERRTLYFYWRSAADILRAAPQAGAWVEGQRAWLWQAERAWSAWAQGRADTAGLQPLPNPHPTPDLGAGANYCIRRGGQVLGTYWLIAPPDRAGAEALTPRR